MAEATQAAIQYIDRPDLEETFVDSIRYVTFDGATIRAEMCVTRVEEAGPGAAAAPKRYTASRLVLRPDAAVDLFMRLQRLIALMEQRGIIKRQEPPKQTDSSTADVLQNPLGSSGTH